MYFIGAFVLLSALIYGTLNYHYRLLKVEVRKRICHCDPDFRRLLDRLAMRRAVLGPNREPPVGDEKLLRGWSVCGHLNSCAAFKT